MDWLTDRRLFACATLLYGCSALYSIFLLRKGLRRDNWLNYGLLAMACSFHTAAMLKRGFSLHRCPINNLHEAVAFITWTISASYLVIGLFSKWRSFGAFASPLLFALNVFALMPGLDPPRGEGSDFSGWRVSLHAVLLLLSYGSFGLASVAGLMYLTQERNLKWRKLEAVFSLIPPIQRLELITCWSVGVGLILLTAGIISGAAFLTPPPGTTFFGDAKVIWSMVVWALYLALMISRWRFGQGGRRFALGSVAGFAFVILTFWGAKLLSGIHSRG